MVASAVADAEENSKLNQLQQKCKFICGKAEETLPEFVKTLDADERMVAVVDPPRAGLHKHVIRALRACPNLNTLVYVSCNPSSNSLQLVISYLFLIYLFNYNCLSPIGHLPSFYVLRQLLFRLLLFSWHCHKFYVVFLNTIYRYVDRCGGFPTS